jgi:hypothetical protein
MPEKGRATAAAVKKKKAVKKATENLMLKDILL